MYLSVAEIKQIQILKEKKPEERFIMMLDLINGQVEALRAGIKYQNPAMNSEELDKCLKERIRRIYSLKH